MHSYANNITSPHQYFNHENIQEHQTNLEQQHQEHSTNEQVNSFDSQIIEQKKSVVSVFITRLLYLFSRLVFGVEFCDQYVKFDWRG